MYRSGEPFISLTRNKPHTPTLTNPIIQDRSSLPLVPDDIPLKPNSDLYPCLTYGDGNCLPRTAGILAYGHEENHLEIRTRIVIELTKNEDRYLNNETMRRGKQCDGNDGVTKAFASYSEYYMGNRLTSANI